MEKTKQVVSFVLSGKIKIIYFVLFIFFVLGNCKYSVAQINLVPNGSFEDTISCPSLLDQIYYTKYWRGYGSVDYFNGCAISQVGVPLNRLGYQVANNGVMVKVQQPFHQTTCLVLRPELLFFILWFIMVENLLKLS